MNVTTTAKITNNSICRGRLKRTEDRMRAKRMSAPRLLCDRVGNVWHIYALWSSSPKTQVVVVVDVNSVAVFLALKHQLVRVRKREKRCKHVEKPGEHSIH